MSRWLLAVNVLLVAVSLASAAFIVKQFVTSPPPSAPRSRPPASASAPPPASEEPRLPAQAYNVIATRNLFNPTRSESALTGVPGGQALNVVKPSLHGVVLRDGAPIAYLEDPLTKRIAGYRIGDPIAGGTVQTISADAVLISRPDGIVDVRLRDPSKARQPAPTPAQPGVSGQPGAAQPPAQQPTQGSIPPRGFVPPPQPGMPAPGMQPPQPNPAFPSVPFGRPSPSLGRRLPPPTADEPAPPPQ